MKILHISSECYPAAKTGGLGDVVGALPKYQNLAGDKAAVIIPKYAQSWILNHRFEPVFSSTVRLGSIYVPFNVQELTDEYLGFSFLVVDIPGLFDREGIYADKQTGFPYHDDVERYIVFQQAVLKYVINLEDKPDILHCHDHHTGLIPFMIKHCPDYRTLHYLPTVFTIHNGNYQGSFGWDKLPLLPLFDAGASGLLDWNHNINPMACAIKCCWQLTTVSPGYLHELQHKSLGLENLFRQETAKSTGIVNGIDTSIWNPRTDTYIEQTLESNVAKYKKVNKTVLVKAFGLHENIPLFVFIGRFASEKGADILPDAIASFLLSGGRGVFLVLGNGDRVLEEKFLNMQKHYEGFFNCAITYNEKLAHQFYAGADFLVMPSRVEPCGLNQLYAYRYGTVPTVRNTGGLSDTVVDFGFHNGTGLKFDNFSVEDVLIAFYRASQLATDNKSMNSLRERIMQLDFSWQKSSQLYRNVYQKLLR